MKCFHALVIVLVSLAASSGNQPQSTGKPKPPIALNAPLEFQMSQRSTIALPGSNDRILITIDDITRGQVMTSLSWRDGNVIVATRSMRENDSLTFTVDGHSYNIELKKLKNRLVRQDTARFELSPAATESAQVLSENDKIEKLISSLRDIDGAKFIRNRQEQTLDKAVTHLTSKWKAMKTEIKTAQDFITIVASRSSTTGKPYLIKLADGTITKSQDWFRRQLKIIEKPPDEGLKQYPVPALGKQIVVTGPNDIELELIYIEPGSFIMGRDTKLDYVFQIISMGFQGNTDEGPPRKVTITKGFYIGKYKVTTAQYCKFLNAPDVNQPEQFIAFNRWSRILKRNGRFVPRPKTEDCAVNTVPWAGANAFCEWLSKSTGRRFRLPTEAEWEFAARGPEGRKFPWGNKEPKWLSKGPIDSNEVKFSKPWMGLPVYSIADKFPDDVTPDGVVGMCSNLGEWVSDYYMWRYPGKDEIDPTGPKEPPVWPVMGDRPGYRVLRRGWLTERGGGLDADDGGVYGFRVLIELDEDYSAPRKVPSVDFPLEFTLRQRTTKPLPYSDGKLLLTLDDITRGQVLVTLASYDGKPVIATRSLRENDIIEFSVGKYPYKLKLKTLTNKLISNDSAVFQLWPAKSVPKAEQPSVQWSDPVNGLSLGIQVPERPFVFVPKRGWTGPVIIREKDDKGRITGMHSNAGGKWEAGAVLTVLVRNSSTNAIFWARDSDVWSVSFSAPGFNRPPPWTGPIPPPHRPGPIRLDPQEETKITFPLSGAFDIWPSIPQGQYSVSVSYSPDRLLPFARGGEGNWTHPYDVLGFWKGKISTPTILIRVKHPTDYSTARRQFPSASLSWVTK